MIVNACGVVLSRRNLGEADRLAAVYAENLGKVHVRFVGVNKPGRKMKALSEPMVWAEYRLFLSPRSEFGKAIGGQIISSFPSLREDFSRTVEGLSCCELLLNLTAERSPNAEKYRLICAALQALEARESPWLPIAYGLKLLELSGYGIGGIAAVAPEDRPLWQALHEFEFSELCTLPWRPETARRFETILYTHVEAQSAKPIKSRQFLEKLGAQASAEGAPC